MAADDLIALPIPPGLFKNGTPYEAKGRWYDANLIRFFEGAKQPVGGWRQVLNADGSDNAPAVTGIPRAMHSWRADTGDRYLVIGSHQRLELFLNGLLYDLTPAGFTEGRADSGQASGGGQYNNGAYGVGLYGVGSTSVTLVDADTWQLDNFGVWLVGTCTSDQKVYIWKNDVSVAAAEVTGTDHPTSARAVVVTPERFIVALGANGNRRLVKWASQGSDTTWLASDTNSAGELEIQSKGILLAGRRTRRETLLFTDTDLWAMTYIGGVLIYRIDQVGDGCGVIAPNAMAIVDGRAYWMGTESFFSYDGFVRPVPSEVGDYVFGDMNRDQRAKITATPISQFGEVWWFYPSSQSNENDRYVVYNYRENHWTVGQLARACGVDAGAVQRPMFCDSLGVIYEHEILNSRVGTTELGPFLADGSEFADGAFRGTGATGFAPITPYLESGPVELGDGTQLMSVDRFAPDILTAGDVQLTLYAAPQPMAAETTKGPYPLTGIIPLRFAARQLRLRFEQVNPTGWRIGQQRIGMRPGGRR